jgi:hypothetical protein
MNLYVWSMLLGAIGLTAMALVGVGGGGHGSAAPHAHGTGDLHVAHGHPPVPAAAPGHAAGQGHSHGLTARSFWTLVSPRYLFSFALGFGTAGELLHEVLRGPLLVVAALAGAIVFERAIADEATAVTAFDQNGQGIVSLEVDGQVVQILATLRPDDRALPSRIRAGQRLRIDEVDAARNRCTVSLI